MHHQMSNRPGEPVIPPELPLSPIPEPPPASPEDSQAPDTPLEPGDWRRVD
jgi:hypothetical protein